MTNQQYQQSRGTAQPFASTPEQASAAWKACNAEYLAAKRAKIAAAKAAGHRFRSGPTVKRIQFGTVA